MPYFIDTKKTHQQLLLDLVNYYNPETIGTLLSYADTDLSPQGDASGVYTVKLINRSLETDTVNITHTKIKLGDILTFTPDNLSWYDPKAVNPDLAQWSASAKAMVIAAIVAQGFVDGKAYEANPTCVVTFSEPDNQYLITFTCTSYLFESVFVHALEIPVWTLAERVVNRMLTGFVKEQIPVEAL